MVKSFRSKYNFLRKESFRMSSEWFNKIGKPCYVVAPMVDASELAWRLLSRRHGAELCYTPMFHSNVFVKDPKYRKDNMITCETDRPLIVQFCGNNPDTMAAAAKLVEDKCDAIDINLGCPQSIAKRGHYGSFLQDEWLLLEKIVKAMTQAVSVPITCKVRVFESIEKSIEYALMLQNAGCSLLTVHGRTREQKGPLTGIASWKHIKAIRETVSVPMFANGNIQCLEDVHRCIEYTKVDGVMSAEGNLTNPAIFKGVNPVSWEMAEQYIELVEKYPCPTSYIRGHLFKMFHKIFTYEENNDIRQILATAQNLDDFKTVSLKIKEKYLPYHEGNKHFDDNEKITRVGFDLILPPWICQPYVRMSPENYTQKMESLSHNQESIYSKREHEDTGEEVMSRKKMKKLQRIARRPVNPYSKPRIGEICERDECPNPLGEKCLYRRCKKCCRDKCYVETLDCTGHKILIRTKREKAEKFENDIENNIITINGHT